MQNMHTKDSYFMKYKKSMLNLGFSALELMFVLAVIAVAMVAVIKTMGSNSDKVNASNMITDVSAITQNIKSAYISSSSAYNNLSNSVAIDLKVIPNNLVINGSNIKNQFPGGEVVIEADSSADFFTVTYTKVPSAVCMMVITQMGGASFQSIKVDGTVVYDAINNIPLKVEEVGAACKNNNQTSIEFAAS